MTSEHLLHGYVAPAPAPPRKGEPVWNLTKDGVALTAELLDQSRAGMELRMLRNGEWHSGRRFIDRADALQHAEHTRQQLLAKGWT
jgi:hypothetical protein